VSECRDAPGGRSRVGDIVSACYVGGSPGEKRQDGRRSHLARRGPGDDTENCRAFLGGRAVSGAGRVAPAADSREQAAGRGRGGSVFSSRPRGGLPTGCEVSGAAGGHEFEPFVAETRQKSAGPT